MRIFICLLFLLLPLTASAQQRDSFFDSYDDYSRFVDSRIMTREYVELIQVLGGRDEYTPEQLNGINQRFLNIFPSDFTSRAVMRKVDLGEGFHQEMRAYWGGGNTGYNYFYVLLHSRDDGLVVLNFSLNSDVSKIMAHF